MRPGGTSEMQRQWQRDAKERDGGGITGREQKKASERQRWRVSGAGLSEGPCHYRAAPVSSVAAAQRLHSAPLTT